MSAQPFRPPRLAPPPLPDAGFEYILTTVELPGSFALRDYSAGARRRIESSNASAAGPDALSERALRRKFEIDGLVQMLLFESFVGADIGTDSPGDESILQPRPQTKAFPRPVDILAAAIVGNNFQVANLPTANLLNAKIRNTAGTKSARHDAHAVEQNVFERGASVSMNFIRH